MKRLIASLAVATAGLLAVLGLGAGTASADYFDVCPSGQSGIATPDTSCVFADSVRAAWYSQPGRTIVAYSPKTGLFYTMQCDSTWTTFWPEAKRCYGVNSFGAVLIVYVN
jgi:hypothetical protein